MIHNSHLYGPGDQHCLHCGALRGTWQTETLCAGRAYDDGEPGDAAIVENMPPAGDADA